MNRQVPKVRRKQQDIDIAPIERANESRCQFCRQRCGVLDRFGQFNHEIHIPTCGVVVQTRSEETQAGVIARDVTDNALDGFSLAWCESH
jgi:hypothetical protein